MLLARALYSRIDDNLRALQITMTSLANDLAEGQDVEDAARSTAAELSSSAADAGHLRRRRAGSWPKKAATTTCHRAAGR